MNNKIKQFIAFGVCSVVALAICISVLVVTVNKIGGDTSATDTPAVINRTELDNSDDSLVKYINTLIDETKGSFVKTKSYTDVAVNNLEASGSDETQGNDTEIFNFAKDKILSAIDSYYEDDFQGAFEKNDSRKLSILLSEKALKKAEYSIGQLDENGEILVDDEGNPVDEQYYFLTYEIDCNGKYFNKEISEMLSAEADASAKKEFVKKIEEECRISRFEAKPESFVIKAKVNRVNDEIDYINVIRNYAVKFNAEFINDAELFGEKEISFVYTVTDTYEYSYAGISFVEDEVTIEHDEEYMLNVNAVIDDDSEYTVEFVSSDDLRVSVDEMGYIKGLKNCDAPVIITVKLSYLGETFTDTCTVYVSVKEGL